MKFSFLSQGLSEVTQSDDMGAALAEVAQAIADDTEKTRRMKSAPSKYGKLVVRSERGKATVAATGPLAHLEEWGSINNVAYASMRRAAGRHGRFKES